MNRRERGDDHLAAVGLILGLLSRDARRSQQVHVQPNTTLDLLGSNLSGRGFPLTPRSGHPVIESPGGGSRKDGDPWKDRLVEANCDGNTRTVFVVYPERENDPCVPRQDSSQSQLAA